SSGSSLKATHLDPLLPNVPKADSNRNLVLYYPSSNNSNLQTDQTPASPIHPSATRTSRMIARLCSTKLLYKASFSTRYQHTVLYFSTTGADY
ncbi:hypothetical protein PENNAL_c0979G06678, partial [Penicillium nalgiovense]